MTRLLAFVENAAEAQIARDAGALPFGFEADPAVAELAMLGADAPKRLDELPRLRRAGHSGAIIDTSPERLLDRLSFADLFAFADACRTVGLACGFAGGLEAPDVPRLLPLRPAFLGFREAIRRPEGGLDAGAIRALTDLLVTPAPQGAHPHPDRVFIRDLVQEMEVGAYGAERGRSQRVRFSIEAELAPVNGPRDLSNIYSYDRMMDAVRLLAGRGHEAFVETLAEMLAAEILSDARVSAAKVRVEKLDLGPGAAGVEIRRERR